MSQSKDRLNLVEQECKLAALEFTLADQWTQLTNILHAYPGIEKIDRSDVILAFPEYDVYHRCTTPYIIFNFYLNHLEKEKKDELIIKVGIGGKRRLISLEELTRYRESSAATGIDREALVALVDKMTVTLREYLTLESELKPWLKLRNIGVNAGFEREQMDEDIMEEERRDLDWNNYGPGQDESN